MSLRAVFLCEDDVACKCGVPCFVDGIEEAAGKLCELLWPPPPRIVLKNEAVLVFFCDDGCNYCSE